MDESVFKTTVRCSLRWLLVGAFALITVTSCSEQAAESERPSFVVKAGIMEPGSNEVDRLHETQTITMNPARRPGWCFLVDPPDDRMYEVYSVTHLPAEPARLSGDFAGQSAPSAGLRSASSQGNGIRPFCFDFDAGDPLGEYRVEVLINGTRQSELRMQVIEPAAAREHRGNQE